MLGFCVLAPLGDAIAKYLGAFIPVFVLLVVRFGVQGVLLLPLCWLTGRSLRLTPRVMRIAWVRAALHIIGIGAMFTALRYLPIADAVAIAFVMPFIMLLLGWAVLGEAVGWRRLAACAVGFCGTLMVIQPAFEDVGWPALLPLVVALVFALYMLSTRIVAKDVDPIALQAVNGFMALALLIPLGGAFWMADLSMLPGRDLGAWQVSLLLGIGIIGTIAHLLMSWSLKFAPSATVAPMQYLEIPFATLIGYLVFEDLPNALAAIGILITMAAGLYIIVREQAMARRAAAV